MSGYHDPRRGYKMGRKGDPEQSPLEHQNLKSEQRRRIYGKPSAMVNVERRERPGRVLVLKKKKSVLTGRMWPTLSNASHTSAKGKC